MIFYRTQPKRRYKDYRKYRPQLRKDFRFCCAYCTLHETMVGGEANYCIDHFRPIRGIYPHPDLECEYTNLYWACRECNENKGANWPSPEQIADGLYFIDPCTPEGDHDLHWKTESNGTLVPKTRAGEYTIEKLKLWRELLVYRRKEIYRWREELNMLITLWQRKQLGELNTEVQRRIAELEERLNPPAFNRPRNF
jgi:hypothetical protein